jgi:hypothetical protein
VDAFLFLLHTVFGLEIFPVMEVIVSFHVRVLARLASG